MHLPRSGAWTAPDWLAGDSSAHAAWAAVEGRDTARE